MQLSIEPFPGWSLGINRLLEFGGGSGLPDSAGISGPGFLQAERPVADPGQSTSVLRQPIHFSRQDAVRGLCPVRRRGQLRRRQLSAGQRGAVGRHRLSAHLAPLRSDLRGLRVAEHLVRPQHFLDGMSSNGLVLGNWGADQRNFGDGVGARSQMLRIGWEPPFGGYLQERMRTVVNETYYGGDMRQYSPGEPRAYPYHHYYDFSVSIRGRGRDIDRGRRGARRARCVRPVLLATVGIPALRRRSENARRRRGRG